MRVGIWHRIALCALLVFTAIALVPGNSESRSLKWHELLVAQTASEMLQRNNSMLPHLMGEIRFKKPPLSYWLSIAAHRVLDKSGGNRISAFEARLPSLISGLLLILVTYGIGNLVTRSSHGGLIAAALIATNSAFFIYSRNARPEMLYTFLCALMLLGLLWSIRRAEQERSTTVAAIVAWSAFSLSLMAKGPQFPLFILLGFVFGVLIFKRQLSLLTVLRPWMVIPALALPLAYFGYLSSQVDNLLSLLGDEMVQGYDVPVWLRPLRFIYPLALFMAVAPCMVAFGVTIRDIWKRREPIILILACCILVSIFLVSFAGKLRFHYILPLVPICAALMAWSMLSIYKSVSAKKVQTKAFYILSWSQFGLVGVIPVVLIGYFMLYDSGVEKRHLEAGVIIWLVIAGFLYVFSGITARRNLATAFIALIASILCTSATFSLMQLDASIRAQSITRFITEVEAYLPVDSDLYLNSTRQLPYYYHSSGAHEILSLKSWYKSQKNEARKKTVFFIIRLHTLKNLEIQGDILIEQKLNRKDKSIRVLFRPS